MIDLSQYHTLILDCDGVILDSNFIKENNIRSVVSGYLKDESLEAFMTYFTQTNGLPRERKIAQFFNETLTKEIVEIYSALNRKALISSNLTEGYLEFHNSILIPYKGKKLVLSGGMETEVRMILEHKGIASVFDDILGGPKTKYEHLHDISHTGKTLYIGDSELDYEVAKTFAFDFIFMSGYTQFEQWQQFVEKHNLRTITNWKNVI